MLKNVQLSIKNPCSESWDRMTPEEQGRFCASCQKLVIDFTSMDDQEVLQWFTLPKGSVCGRFRQDQLRRSLVANPEKKRSKWRYWHYLVAGLLFSSEISAQSDPHRPPIGQHISPGERNRLLIGDTTATSAPGFSQDAAETQGLVVIAGRVSAHKSKRDTLTLVKDTLACIGLGKKALTVYPNPIARGNSITITARLDQLGIYIVQLFSISGSLLETQEVPGGQKAGNISMNIPATLTPGAYVVRLSNSTAGKSYTQQVVVY